MKSNNIIIVFVLLFAFTIFGCKTDKKTSKYSPLEAEMKRVIGTKKDKSCKFYVFSQYDCISCLNSISKLVLTDYNVNNKKYKIIGIFYSNSNYYNAQFDSLFAKTSCIEWHKTTDIQLLNSIEKSTGELFAPCSINTEDETVYNVNKIYVNE